MPELPFDIPKSLSVYIEQFEEDPTKVTNKLRNQLRRRGPDAVGFFLLAWFYHLQNMNDKALEYALMAKICAPGSPLMEKLHYYLSHPDRFQAWTPEEGAFTGDSSGTRTGPDPVLDLDSLVARLSKVEHTRITPPSHGYPDEEDQEQNQLDTDDIASETLAQIYETQGKTKKAIRTYEKLKKINKDRESHYDEQISRLEEILEKQEEEEG